MAYKYGIDQHNPPTVDEMFGEYKIARIHFTIREFLDLYPETTDAQLKELSTKFDQWWINLSITRG